MSMEHIFETSAQSVNRLNVYISKMLITSFYITYPTLFKLYPIFTLRIYMRNY